MKKGLQVQFPADPLEAIDKKLDKFFFVLFSVGVVFAITLIVMVITLLIDSFHFNSATYKEYSKKTEAVDQVLKANRALMDQNQKDQNIILQQLSQIQELLKNSKVTP